MAIARLFTGTAEGNVLQNRHIIFHHRGFPDHNAGGVVEHDAVADARRRMDIHRKGDRNLVLQIHRQ